MPIEPAHFIRQTLQLLLLVMLLFQTLALFATLSAVSAYQSFMPHQFAPRNLLARRGGMVDD